MAPTVGPGPSVHDALVQKTANRRPAAWTVFERAGLGRRGPRDDPDSEWSASHRKCLAPAEAA